MKTEHEIPLFSEVVARLGAGAVDTVLAAELAALVEAVALHEKPGTLTVKIAVDTIGMNGSTVTVTVDHTLKPPKSKPSGSVLYVGNAGSLHRDDPYQQTLPTPKDHS